MQVLINDRKGDWTKFYISFLKLSERSPSMSLGPVRKLWNMSDGQIDRKSQNKNSWLITSASILDKKV